MTSQQKVDLLTLEFYTYRIVARLLKLEFFFVSMTVIPVYQY
jgi:hypothetical protein